MRAAALSFLAILMLALSCGGKKVQIERFVYDHENVFDADEEKRLDTLFRGHELRTTNEIALVTTASYHGETDLRSFAATCGDSLRVGKKRKNNGVVMVFSQNLREVFIATGLGTERVMGEERCQKLIDSLMLPLFKEGMYFDGVWQGSVAMVNYLELPGNEIK